jgi:hypothetical protein
MSSAETGIESPVLIPLAVAGLCVVVLCFASLFYMRFRRLRMTASASTGSSSFVRLSDGIIDVGVFEMAPASPDPDPRESAEQFSEPQAILDTPMMQSGHRLLLE